MNALPRWAAWSVASLLLAGSVGCSSSKKPPGRDADAPLTASGSCRTRAERCNGQDDDCDGIVDERADSSCGLAHAAGRCVVGRCTIARCTEGYYDCNGMISDGCESKTPCDETLDAGHDAATPAEPMTSSDEPPRSQPAEDASIRPAQSAEAPRAGRPSTPDPDAADGGEDIDASGPASCDGRRCDEPPELSCKETAPTGQGPKCDECVCDACPAALAGCTGTEDDQWNRLCGALLACFGRSVQAGLCTGDDSDCFQNGDGPCVNEFLAAFELGWSCTADPVRTPCGALTRVRLECYRDPCATVCKA